MGRLTSEEEGAPHPADAIGEEDSAFAAELAAIDALLLRSDRALALSSTARSKPAETMTAAPSPEGENRFAAWQAIVADFGEHAPVLAAAHAMLAWSETKPYENADWLGRLLAADFLRARHKTRVHLLTINIGLRAVAREKRQSRDPKVRLEALLLAIKLAAEAGLRDHDRWLAGRRALETKLRGRRSTSNLPRVVDMVMARPLITTTLVAKELSITPRSAQDLIAALGLRELSGRSRYRAWGVL